MRRGIQRNIVSLLVGHAYKCAVAKNFGGIGWLTEQVW
jgi:hypothetical protein